MVPSAARRIPWGSIDIHQDGHLEKSRITHFFRPPIVNFNYRLGEGVINQRVTINTMGVFFQNPYPL